jgi:UDP-N-acetylglucosamine:LPS N-acetylglucosamine transferase
MRLLMPLFSPATGTWGGLTRVIAVGEAAERSGHQIAFCASGYLEESLRNRGYRVYSMPPTTMLGLPKPLSRVLERRSQRASIPVKPGKSIGSIWLVLWFSGYGRARFMRRLVEAEVHAAKDFRADRIFTDLDPGAYLTSVVTGIPLASTHAKIATHGSGTWAWRRMSRIADKVLRSNGLPASSLDELCFGPSVLKIIPSIPELDGTDAALRDVRYVGHLISPILSADAVDFQVEEGKRNVFIYVGTGSISLDTLRRVLPEVFPSNGGWHCYLGAQSITEVHRVEAVEFRPYVPAELLLPRCAWTICHGGQNTIIQSLLCGVPLLIFPGPVFERRYNAEKVEAAMAGIMGEVNMFTAAWLRESLQKQEEYATQARVLGQRIGSLGGPDAAVDAIANSQGS